MDNRVSDPVTDTDENDREDEQPEAYVNRMEQADPSVVDLGCCDEKGDEHELGGEG